MRADVHRLSLRDISADAFHLFPASICLHNLRVSLECFVIIPFFLQTKQEIKAQGKNKKISSFRLSFHPFINDVVFHASLTFHVFKRNLLNTCNVTLDGG